MKNVRSLTTVEEKKTDLITDIINMVYLIEKKHAEKKLMGLGLGIEQFYDRDYLSEQETFVLETLADELYSRVQSLRFD